jgi:hypothetical protein
MPISNLGSLDAGNLFEVAPTDFQLADFEFLHSAAYGHRKAVHEADTFQDFEVRNLSFAKISFSQQDSPVFGTPFGKPVVPEVYGILKTSYGVVLVSGTSTP